VDQAFLARLARDRAIRVSLRHPGGEIAIGPAELSHDDDPVAVGELQVPLIRVRAGGAIEDVQARLRVTQSMSPLRALLRSADSWFLATAAGTGLTALVLAVWVSSRISRPLADLAEKTAVLDLDRLDVQFDEVRTKSDGCRGFWASSPHACAAARPACARPNIVPRWAIWPARSTTISRTA
jgi:hypothetical protein